MSLNSVKRYQMKKHALGSLINLAFLFGAKIGSIVTGIVFLPLFDSLLGVEQFGILALILSLQALLLMLDLGMATLVGRDVAVGGYEITSPQSTWHNSEVVMTALYIIFCIVIMLFWAFQIDKPLSLSSMLGIVILFWALILQNISYSAITGVKSYKTASFFQLTGTLLKASVSFMALKYISPTLEVFIYSQLIVGLIHLCIIRVVCDKALKSALDCKFRYRFEFINCVNLAKRGKALILVSLSGALVMNLDKSIIAYFMNPADLVPYFYAFSLAMLPMSILAGPVKQYFQPIVLENIFDKEKQNILIKSIKLYAVVLTSIVMVPSILLWSFSTQVVELWLGDNQSVGLTVNYLKILLPGMALGSLGYLPYVFLVAIEDFTFQAFFSIFMTTFVLIGVSLFSFNQDIYLVCILYSAYHILSTIGLWIRACLVNKVTVASLISLVYSFGVMAFLSIFAILLHAK